MKKILLTASMLFFFGFSIMAQDKTAVKKTRADLSNAGATNKKSESKTDIDARIAEKQRDFEKQKVAGTNTKFSKATTQTTGAIKKD